MSKKILVGPNYEEMLHPWKIDKNIRERAKEMKTKDPLHPINLYNITWRDFENKIYHFVLTKEITGVDANIVVLYAKEFPSGSHKVGPTYSCLVEKAVTGEVDPEKHILVWPSTGNYGIGGAFVGNRMNYKSIVILPEEMSQERFDLIRKYGSEVIATPGCESNVKEIYDKTHELKANDPERIKILNQFNEFGNYRFHYHVTGGSMIEAVKENSIGNSQIAGVVLGVGSSGTIASGDRIKKDFPNAKVFALEPIQCPTIALNGYGGHDIQGIGDKHVTWIHNVMNMDGVVLVDDMDSKKMMQLFFDETGKEYLKKFADNDLIDFISDKLGISGVANIIGAIKMAKHYDMKAGENIVVVATDSISRYYSVLDQLDKEFGKLDLNESKLRHERIFLKQEPSYIYEGTKENKERWHNLKYFTWIEQQGKTIEELNAQKNQEYWEKQAEKAFEYNEIIKKYREDHKEILDDIFK
jgi:cysteine synthase